MVPCASAPWLGGRSVARSPRRLVGLPLLIAVVGLGSGCQTELYHDLPERRVNEALLTLREVGIAADKRLEQRGGAGRPSSFALTVPAGDETRALTVLAQRSLPRLPERPPAASSRLLFSPSEQRAETNAVAAAALADTLERLPEVVEARVHLALPESEPLSPLGTLRPTAAVLLRLRAPLTLQPTEVAELVARAVSGLDAHDVVVVRALTPSAPPLGRLELTSLGPLQLAAESRPLAMVLLGLVLGLAVACGLLLQRLLSRRPPLRPERPARII